MPRPPAPNYTTQLDVCGPLSTTASGNSYFVNIICLFSKAIRSYPIPNQSAKTLAKVLFQYVCENGTPRQILLDNFSSHRSELFTEFCKLMNIEYVYCTFYSKKTTGAVERSIYKTWSTLALLQGKLDLSAWDEYLPYINAIHKAVPHTATNATPFYLETGRIFRFPWINAVQPSRYFYNIEDYNQNLKNTLKIIYNAASQVNEKECSKFVRAHNKKHHQKNLKWANSYIFTFHK